MPKTLDQLVEWDLEYVRTEEEQLVRDAFAALDARERLDQRRDVAPLRELADEEDIWTSSPR